MESILSERSNGERSDARICQPRLIVIRRTFAFASEDFGTVMVRTPFLNAAETFSSSTRSSGIRRQEGPGNRRRSAGQQDGQRSRSR
jgi:hypothetical protein